MKKSILMLAFLVQSVYVMAQDPIVVKLKSDNVTMYRQPGRTAEVVKSIGQNEDVTVVRKFNADWSIVTVNGETGYISNMHLPKVKKTNTAAASLK